MNRIAYIGPALLLLVAIILTMLLGPQIAGRIEWSRTDARIEMTRQDLGDSEYLAGLSRAFRHVAEIVQPSVVSIQVRFVAPVASPGEDGTLVRQGGGSGWVFDSDGHIITNAHVVKHADRIMVRFANGAEYPAQLVNSDRATDIAVLRVAARNLHPARIAAADVRQGDMVFAFGSPFMYEFSMSQGVVSGTGRHAVHPARAVSAYEWFIQTDATINPGNSGGPLTNVYGEVVGMNTAIATHDGSFNGVGLAIPVHLVRKVVDQIIETGEMRRGFMGVILPMRDMDYALARSLGLERQGVIIEDLAGRDAPAALAGLLAGDVITHVNDEPIQSISHLRYTVSTYPPGTEVNIRLIRRNQPQKAVMVLAEHPPSSMPFERRRMPQR